MHANPAISQGGDGDGDGRGGVAQPMRATALMRRIAGLIMLLSLCTIHAARDERTGGVTLDPLERLQGLQLLTGNAEAKRPSSG